MGPEALRPGRVAGGRTDSRQLFDVLHQDPWVRLPKAQVVPPPTLLPTSSTPRILGGSLERLLQHPGHGLLLGVEEHLLQRRVQGGEVDPR